MRHWFRLKMRCLYRTRKSSFCRVTLGRFENGRPDTLSPARRAAAERSPNHSLHDALDSVLAGVLGGAPQAGQVSYVLRGAGCHGSRTATAPGRRQERSPPRVRRRPRIAAHQLFLRTATAPGQWPGAVAPASRRGNGALVTGETPVPLILLAGATDPAGRKKSPGRVGLARDVEAGLRGPTPHWPGHARWSHGD